MKSTILSPIAVASALFAISASAVPTGTPSDPFSSLFVKRDVQTGQPDPAPAGFEEYISPIFVPSPNTSASAGSDWEVAIKKAQAFVAQLTPEELVNITTGQGLFGRCVGNTGEVPRIGFRGFCLQDSPLGVRLTDGNSAFPAAINVAATWSKDLIYQRGVAMGAEFRGKGVNVALSPMMNVMRTPEAGRNWEGFGADPYMSGFGAALTVQGIQSNGVIACAKHFIGNEQEHFRGGSGAVTSSSDIDERTLHEVYNHAFAEAIRAGVGSMMCSYNRINQTHACENSYVMNHMAKEQLTFHGFIVSDWAAATTGVSAALAGLDMMMPGFTAYGVTDDQSDPVTSNSSYWGAALLESINNGSVPLWRVQDAITRAMAAYYKMGQDSKEYPAPNFSVLTYDTYDANGTLVNEHVNVQGDHYKLIREIGAKSTILLKNQGGALPLNVSDVKKWGIFGSDAGPSPLGANGFSDRGGDEGTLAMGWGSGSVNFPYLVTPLQAIDAKIRATVPNAIIEAVLNDTATTQIDAAARASDKCLVFVNSDSGEGYITVDGNEGDRNNLSLWHFGDQLIQEVAGNCSNTIVVVHSVGPVDMSSWVNNDNVTAILWAGLPGQESGNSLVDVMFGDVNPSGKLPYTIARNRSDYGADVLYTFDNSTMPYPQIVYNESLLVDYRWFDAKGIEPQYAFGFGMSYTDFEYSSLSVSSPLNKPPASSQASGVDTSNSTAYPSSIYDELYTVTYTVKNVGPVSGAEVSQLYLGFPPTSGEPPKVLRDFAITDLEAGASDTVSITLNRKAFMVWSVADQTWEIPEGNFEIMIGASSQEIKLTQTIDMVSTMV